VTCSEPLDLEKILFGGPETVTHTLETLTAESLSAEVISQYLAPADEADALAVTRGQSLIRRIAVLRGSPSGVPYLYAESTFVAERLPEGARYQLEHTSDPIGRVLVAHGLPLTRDQLTQPDRPYPTAAVTAGSPMGIVWARAYRLRIGSAPVFAIREWFFESVVHALARSGST
jgi:chorismate-pyruvate lyase